VTDTLLVRSPDVLTRSFADEVLLASPAGGDVDRLEGSAAEVWDLLEEPRSMEDLVSTLARAYGVPAEQVRSGVEALLRELLERGWVYEIQDSDD
jgi:hypothetical protein